MEELFQSDDMKHPVKGNVMDTTKRENNSDCREYCEPILADCLKHKVKNEPCDEKFKQCLSFCAYA
jgi:hypothetical protein